MKLLLDTTYLLPAIGIPVKSVPKDTPIKLSSANPSFKIQTLKESL